MEELNKLYRTLILLNAALFELDKSSDKNVFKELYQEELKELDCRLESINYNYILSKLSKIVQNSKLKIKQ
jgi:hypothetical protein